MEAVRTFIIRNEKWFFRSVIGGIVILCLLITGMEYQADGILWFLAGLGLLAMSLHLGEMTDGLCVNTHTAQGEKVNSQYGNVAGIWRVPAAYLLLGIAIYCFPATAAAVPFYVGDALRRNHLLRYGIWIPVGVYITGVPEIIRNRNMLQPVHHLISWLNVGNVFDHNLSFWSLVTGREQLRFGLVAVVLTLGALLIGLFWYVAYEKSDATRNVVISATDRMVEEAFLLWSVWTCLLFLPYGHAEDGMVLIMVLLFSCHGLLRHRLYLGILFLQAAETLFMLGSAYGGYERFGYDFYQIAVGLNVLAWLVHSYRMLFRMKHSCTEKGTKQ